MFFGAHNCRNERYPEVGVPACNSKINKRMITDAAVAGMDKVIDMQIHR